jgi:hypothetical protein
MKAGKNVFGRLFFNRNSDQLRCDQVPQYVPWRS